MARRASETALCLLLISTLAAAAAPFGIEPGSPVASLGEVREIAPGKYMLASPPKKHPDLITYSAWASVKSGVCLVRASTAIINNDAYGSKTKEEFEKLKQQLDKNYGKGSASDFLRSGSIWNSDREWMMSVYKDERVVQSAWHPNNAKADRIATILLAVVAKGSDSAVVSVQYEFSNFAACEKELEEGDAGAL